MSTRIVSNVMDRHNKVPFHSLVNDDDEDLMRVEEQSIGHAQETPKFKSMVDRLVGNLRKQRPYVEARPRYKHEKLSTLNEGDAYHVSEQRDDSRLQKSDRSSSLDHIDDLCCRSSGGDIGEENTGSSPAVRGRRRSRSDSDLIACEIFARRRAAICEEMERNIFMENGVTLRKCRKNLVLNQILENLSLL